MIFLIAEHFHVYGEIIETAHFSEIVQYIVL